MFIKLQIPIVGSKIQVGTCSPHTTTGYFLPSFPLPRLKYAELSTRQ